jgi:beta-1,4-mannosyl-glycoprotein beta-1,4-N-acetylglucosaminyltransferase
MKIIDCTTYYAEDLMLDVRLNILNEYVDKFVIVESKFSHSGKPKKLNFDINNFKKFKDKIQYLVIEKEPDGINQNRENISAIKRTNSLLRIEQSYDYMINALDDVGDNDLICLSDNDEIPNFESQNFKNSKNDIFIFKQLFFYYKFNLFYNLMPWYGTKACKKKKLVSFSWLRNLKTKKYPFWRLDTIFSNLKQRNLQIVENGGWHFTNLMTAEDIYTKLSNFGHHNEFDDSGVTIKDIQKCIDDRIVNYDHQADKTENEKYGANYKLKVIKDDLLPKYLIMNKEKYKDWFDNLND